MQDVQTHDRCPLCGSARIRFALSAGLGRLPGDVFALWQCETCSFLFTQNAPRGSALAAYYGPAYYRTLGSDPNIWWACASRVFRSVVHLPALTRRVVRAAGLHRGRLLDMGAGTGEFAARMQRRGWDVTCMDVSDEARRLCTAATGAPCLGAESLLQLAEMSFDVITLWHVLEHVENMHGTMEQIHRLLHPGGVCLIALPNHDCPQARRYGGDWFPYDVPRHLWHFSPRTLRLLAEQHSLEFSAVRSFPFNSLYYAMCSEARSARLLRRWVFSGFMDWGNAALHQERAPSFSAVLRRSGAGA